MAEKEGVTFDVDVPRFCRPTFDALLQFEDACCGVFEFMQAVDAGTVKASSVIRGAQAVLAANGFTYRLAELHAEARKSGLSTLINPLVELLALALRAGPAEPDEEDAGKAASKSEDADVAQVR